MNNQDKIMRFLMDWKGTNYPYRKDIHNTLQIKDIDNLLDHLHKEGQIKIDKVYGNGEDDGIMLVNENYFYDKKLNRNKSLKTFILSVVTLTIGVIITNIFPLFMKWLKIFFQK